MTNTNNSPVISVWIVDHEAKEHLRIEAAKRGISLSRYAGLLLEKATKGFTDFDIEGYEETFPTKYKPRRVKNDNSKH
jgi:hypothetical protein